MNSSIVPRARSGAIARSVDETGPSAAGKGSSRTASVVLDDRSGSQVAHPSETGAIRYLCDMTMQITWDQALAWRMRRHYLIDRASPKQIVEVVDRLRGLHAQVMSSVDPALWARIDGLRREDVADALWNKRTLVKMWAMRATLHVLPAADLGTWIGGLSIWKPGVWPLRN